MFDLKAQSKRIYEGTLLALLSQGYPHAVAIVRAKAAASRPLLPTNADGAEDHAWLRADEQRRSRHYARRICYEADAWVTNEGGSFEGEMGVRLFEVLLRSRYNAGERDERLRQLRQIWQFGYHFMGRVVKEFRLVRRAAFEVDPRLSSAAGWRDLRKDSGIDEKLAAAEIQAVATGAVGLWPRHRIGQMPVIEICPADKLSAWEGVRVRHGNGEVVVNDLREPAWPIWRRYKTTLRAGLYACEPVQVVEGPAYPWRNERGAPVFQTTIYRGLSPDDDPLPLSKQLLDGTMEIADLMLRKEWVSRVGQFERLFVAGKISNVEAAAIDPAVLIGIEGLTGEGKNSLVASLKSAAGEFAAWNEDIAERIAMYGSQFYSGLEVQRKTEKAQSGLAIKLKANDKWQIREDFARADKPLDQALLQATVSVYNAQVASGELPGYAPIPLHTWALEYPPSWTQDEQREMLTDIAMEIDKGYGTATSVDLVLRRSGGNPSDPAERQRAMTLIARNAAEIDAMRRMGLLPNYKSAPPAPPETDDEAVTHTPPPEVARNATKGLRLRDEFKRGLGAEAGGGAAQMSTQDKRLKQRAQALVDRAPMSTGDLRKLDAWLEAHKGDRDGDANWGNDADPSGAYITWLTQGGDEGLDWTNATLAEADAPPVDNA